MIGCAAKSAPAWRRKSAVVIDTAQASPQCQANAASAVKLPPLPQPEPPMARYWAAYAECMQGRGYVVVQ